MSEISAFTWVGMIATPTIISIGQVLFKKAGERASELEGTGMLGVLTDGNLILAVAIYGIGTLVWVYVLRSVPLSVAYPFMALTFCLVPLLAWYFLGETVSWRYAAGLALVLGGLFVINSGGPSSVS